MCDPVLMFFFFNDTATTEIYTLSLHDALPISKHPVPPISRDGPSESHQPGPAMSRWAQDRSATNCSRNRSEEHTSELQSRQYLVCRLLLEKKKTLKQSQPSELMHSLTLTT